LVSLVFGVWKDTAGTEQYMSCSRFFSRNAAAALVVYDVTDRKSFDVLDLHWNMVVKEAPDCVFVLVGNKFDLVEAGTMVQVKILPPFACARATYGLGAQAVSVEEARAFALSHNIVHVTHASAKTGLHLQDIFDVVCKKVAPTQFLSDASSEPYSSPSINAGSFTLTHGPPSNPSEPFFRFRCC